MPKQSFKFQIYVNYVDSVLLKYYCGFEVSRVPLTSYCTHCKLKVVIDTCMQVLLAQDYRLSGVYYLPDDL